MLLYDQGASVDWFYTGTQTYDEIRADPLHKALTEVPCVLYDNGAGKAYSFEPLESACARWAVPYTGNPEQDFDSLKNAMAGTYKAPGVAEAQQTADEAKTLAEQAGTDPQLQALATMQVATMDLSAYNATQVVSFRDYWPEWQEGVSYKQNDCVRYGGKYWRVSQDTTSQAIYPPGTSESLYYEVELATDGIIVYRMCHGEYDMVRQGELRHYPDAEGPVYRAKVDTAYSPDTVPGNWELVDGEPTEPDEGETTTEPEEPSDDPTEPTIPVFVQPTGAHNAYNVGDRVHYPTADDPIYVSTIDGNVWAPDAYPQGWQLEE